MALTIERWFDEATLKGMQKGMQQGRRAEAANMLLLLLRTRFGLVPDELAARVQAAAADVIEMWFERAINAPSLSAVFGDAPPPA